MPELPEVETVVRDLRGVLAGRRIGAVSLGRHMAPVSLGGRGILRFPTAAVLTRELPGRRVATVERRGKFIFCRLDGGGDLVFHLGMTGHVTVCAASAPVALHTHLRAALDGGVELRFDDIRRFGRILFGPQDVLEERGVLPRLGVEPLSIDFAAESLSRGLNGTTRTVKAALLDQAVVAGLGNIYVDEACHLAGIRPSRRAHRLARRERAALAMAIPAVLATAIRNRGTTFDDFRDIWNARGANGEALQVYGRGGAPCLRCSAILRRTVVAGRTTVHCPSCQR